MAVPRAVSDDELLAGAARAECGIAQPDPGQRAIASDRRNDLDEPAGGPAADREQAAAARRQERVGHTGAAHAGGDAIETVALADGPEIQLDAGPGEAHRPAPAVERDRVEPDGCAGGVDRGRRRHAPFALQESPAAAERCRRDVEGSAGRGVQLATAVQQSEQRLVYLDRPIGRDRRVRTRMSVTGADLVVRAAVDALDREGVDIILSNQSHPAWCAALRRNAFLSIPSNFVFAPSPRLGERIRAVDPDGRDVHLTRGDDGGGPLSRAGFSARRVRQLRTANA